MGRVGTVGLISFLLKTNLKTEKNLREKTKLKNDQKPKKKSVERT